MFEQNGFTNVHIAIILQFVAFCTTDDAYIVVLGFNVSTSSGTHCWIQLLICWTPSHFLPYLKASLFNIIYLNMPCAGPRVVRSFAVLDVVQDD